jgi:hypothetical protein
VDVACASADVACAAMDGFDGSTATAAQVVL